LTLMTAH